MKVWVGCAFAVSILCCAATSIAGVTDAPKTAEKQWQEAMAATPLPGKGCFDASFPALSWREIACESPELEPLVVGNGYDRMAQVTSGRIRWTQGTFGIAGVTTVTDNLYGSNHWTIQMNTNRFSTPACSGAANTSTCEGWQQFVYSNRGSGSAYLLIQYWLLNYGNPCPPGWSPYGTSCVMDSPAAPISSQAITNLPNMVLTGQIINLFSSYLDSALIAINGTNYVAINNDSVLSLRPNWTQAEFNVFGRSNGSQAQFNVGSTIYAELLLNNGTSNAPLCITDGQSGETNNLILGLCQSLSGGSTGIRFTQTK